MTHPSQATEQDIIALLRAGMSQRHIKEQLHVGGARVAAARAAAGIKRRTTRIPLDGPDTRQAAIEARHPQVAAMLRAGASYRQITAATGTTAPTIAKVRRALQIPVPPARNPHRTIPEALAHHTQPHGDGHAHWNGPHSRGQPQLWAEGQVFSARREIYRLHNGRTPQGPVRTTCEQPGCISPEHLADDIDRQYTAIFGPDAP